jgi:ribose transport system ATP-binding protein
MNSYAVKMDNINKSFDGVKVLYDVGLALREGEVLGLVGKNGAGKSTLVKILYGVEAPDNGSIEVFSEKLYPMKTSYLQRQNIAMIFQELSLIPTLTVAENIFLHNLPNNKFHFLDIKKCREMASNILSSINVHLNLDEVVENLGVADKQCVEIAKMLSQNRRILIMDEPTSALSSDQAEILFKVIRSLKEQGVSIIYISHNLRQVFEICDRIAVIRDGKNVFECKVEDAKIDNIVYAITGIETKTKINYLQSKRDKEKNRNLKPILKAQNISFSNRLHNVSFEVYPGEVLGIAGLTGSGRTELLETLYGINRLQKGSIYINGKEVTNTSPDKSLRAGLMLIPDERQTKGLVMIHSVLNNMILPVLEKVKSILFLDYKKSLNIGRNLSKELNIIIPSFHLPVSNLSGGNQQKVVLSKAIAIDSQILLLDDPILGIDVESKREIAEIIKEYVASGRRAAILVSSEMDIIADICDRVLILRDGEVISEIENNDKNPVTEEKLLSLV